jgi:hypothetical protein
LGRLPAQAVLLVCGEAPGTLPASFEPPAVPQLA